MIDLFRCNIGIADESFMQTHKEYATLKELSVFNKRLVVIRLSGDNLLTGNNSPRNIVEGNDFLLSSKPMFFCSTSGTTGKPKLVQVPFKCLLPNVMSLRLDRVSVGSFNRNFFKKKFIHSNHYNITPSDVIYISSPPTFDPFVVDLCLGLFNGATILMVSNEIRLSTNRLLSSIDMNGVTIMQITPSLFRRFPVEAIQSLLSSSSTSLRCLILGGEPFPSMEEVSLWFTVNDGIQMHARLFNIYGITEVSCWSTIYELTSADIECKNVIPIGVPLDHYTTLKVVDCVDKEIIESGIGQLFIESKVRICDIYENGQLSNISGSTATGDLVEIKSGTIYYKTRVNNMVKIFGRKVNLTKIENVTKAYWPVKDACCVFDKDANSLNLFVQRTKDRTYSKREILQGLRQKLLEQEVPNELHFIDEFPLSCHGKVSKVSLLDSVRKPSSDFHRNYFLTKLEENLPNFHVDITLQSSFLAAGGSSVLALQLINELESKFNLVDPELIAMLLNTETCIERILLRLQNHRSNDLPIKTVKSVSESFTWSHDLTKCIDAIPSICMVDNRSVVSVGSHSHILVNVDLLSGELLSKLTLPDRIECQVVQFDNLGIVGCYNGFVYCFDLRSGVERWKFNSKGMVKSKACIVQGSVGKLVVFGNYVSESNLWCLRADDGTMQWNTKIGNKSIYAGIIVTSNGKLFISTLDGVCAAIEPLTGTSVWETRLHSPIFSTPIALGNNIYVAEVLGTVHCIDQTIGKILDSFKAGGNIYSPIESIDDKTICFGCYDKCVYGISLEDNGSQFNLLWKVELPGQIFASPKSFKFQSADMLVACSTNGDVCFIDSNREITKQFRIDGEIFSTPSVVDNRIVLGSRNNFLYCYDLTDILKRT
ncbi:hypothetical protein HA402_004796 [Bradysia odoriphaga]|nr:hypothetical protein HA402_004796 [Bradysia odoriphaga]